MLPFCILFIIGYGFTFSKVINIVCPFGGRILKRHFAFGQEVSKGDIILELDTAALNVQLRDARSNLFKVEEDYNKMKNWEQSNDVIRARRSHLKAQNAYQELEQRIAQTQVLYDKGIIPREELAGLQRQIGKQLLQRPGSQVHRPPIQPQLKPS